MTDPLVQADRRRLPLGAVVVAVAQFIRAALLIGQMLGLTLFSGDLDWLRMSAQIPDPVPGTVAFAISRIVGGVLVAASILAGLGMLAGRRSGWIGAIVLSGLSLAFALGAWWDGHPVYVSMVINVVAVFYLNQREVRAAYDRPVDDGEPAP